MYHRDLARHESEKTDDHNNSTASNQAHIAPQVNILRPQRQEVLWSNMRLVVDLESISREAKDSSTSYQCKDRESLSRELDDVDETDLGVDGLGFLVEVRGCDLCLEFGRLHY